jgi:hypothetical protein
VPVLPTRNLPLNIAFGLVACTERCSLPFVLRHKTRSG